MGPVHSPAAVTIPLQQHSKQKDNTQSNRPNKNQTKQQAPKTQRGK
jgi:hypothetical protein